MGELTFTIKVSNLSTISSDARWQVEWGTSPRYFVNMMSLVTKEAFSRLVRLTYERILAAAVASVLLVFVSSGSKR